MLGALAIVLVRSTGPSRAMGTKTNNNKKTPAGPWQFYKDKNLRSFFEVPLGSRPSPNWPRCE